MKKIISFILFSLIFSQDQALFFDGDNDYVESGYHSINWNGSNHASGVYIVQIQANGFKDTQKIMLLK
tara:strand:+ start:104 stop:307 length:204 start_codon:yes stop_codon:yes gene_type:complete